MQQANRLVTGGIVLALIVVVILVMGVPRRADAGHYPATNTTDTTPPSAPTTLTVSTPAEGQVNLDWTAAEDPDSGIGGYIIYRSNKPFADADKQTDEVDQIGTPGNVLTFTDTMAIRGETVYYAVSAENGAGLEGYISAVATTTVTGKEDPHIGYSTNTRLCRDCHRIHKARGAFFLARLSPEIENCYLCHDGTGSDYNIRATFESLAAHDSTALATVASANNQCNECHDPHGVSVMAHEETRTLSPWMTKSPEESLCLRCHTLATSVNQWSIANQFSLRSRHGVTTDTGDGFTGGRVECSSCHGPHTSAAGTGITDIAARLSDPFNTYNFWTGTLTNFCLACHQSNGLPEATASPAAFVPYTIIFPDVGAYPFFSGWDKTAFTSAGHNAEYTCRQCHHPHGSENQRLVASFDSTTYDSSATAGEENLCYRCHQSGGPDGAKDVKTQFEKTSAHPIATTETHSDTESAADFGDGKRHAECVDCHDVHTASAGTHTEGTNTVSNVLNGAIGVAVGNGPAGSEPTYTVVRITKEYQLCFKCHSSYTTLPGGAPNLAVEFNPNNPSYHPVEGMGTNSGIDTATFIGDWSAESLMYCSDCHSTDDAVSTTTPSGPHGSSIASMLKNSYSHTSGGNGAGTGADLCYACHNYAVYFSGQPGSRFRSTAQEPDQGHNGHVGNKGFSCYYCHTVHGSTGNAHLIRLKGSSETNGITDFNHSGGGGSCKATCHQNPNKANTYTHAY